MRRVGILAAVLAFTAGGALLLDRGGSPDEYRFAAIFDTARGLVPGQRVKIAGAVVGTVEAVRLAPGPKARVVMRIARRFAPLGADATCRILPEGLISENYVECEPGTVTRASLAAGPDGLPTVPVRQTAVPTSLQQLLDVFSLPVGQRVRVILNELGLATAGRGEDLNALIRRSNPALGQTRRVLAIIDGQRRQLAHAVSQTDRVMASLATRDADVRAFVGNAAAVTETTSAHRRALAASVTRLPAMLDAARPSLRALNRATARTRPLLGDLRASAGGLRRLTEVLPAFIRTATPAVRSLPATARSGRGTARAARPVVKRVDALASELAPFADQLDGFLTNTRDQGGIEGLLRTVYSIAVSFAAYDSVSHFTGLAVGVAPTCLANRKAEGCSANYSAPGNGTIPPDDPSCGPQPLATWDPPTTCSATRSRSRRRQTRAPVARGDRPRVPSAPPSSRPPAVPKLPAPKVPRVPSTPGVPDDVPPLPPTQDVPDEVGHLLDYLLGP